MALLLLSLLLLAFTGPSSAAYCVCKDGESDQVLQKALDYACGAGADCTPIQQNGACYQPNTVKNHCDYAVNSYFQRKGQAVGSCDFAGAATTSASVPTQASGCVFPSSPSPTGGTTTITPPTSTTPPAGTTPSITPTTPSTTPTTPTATPTTPTTTSPPGTTTTTPTNTPTTGVTPNTTTPSATPSIYNTGSGLGPTSITNESSRRILSAAALAFFLLPLLSLLLRA